MAIVAYGMRSQAKRRSPGPSSDTTSAIFASPSSHSWPRTCAMHSAWCAPSTRGGTVPRDLVPEDVHGLVGAPTADVHIAAGLVVAIVVARHIVGAPTHHHLRRAACCGPIAPGSPRRRRCCRRTKRTTSRGLVADPSLEPQDPSSLCASPFPQANGLACRPVWSLSRLPKSVAAP